MKPFLFAGLFFGAFQPVSGSPTGPCFRRRAFSWWFAGFASGVLVFSSGDGCPAFSPRHPSLVLTAVLHRGSPGFFDRRFSQLHRLTISPLFPSD
ncbi:hypothetical protein F2Q68_00030288 [Brassica cretica]|uniref:Secreted protein n=1 Tax=Brassica cretica TaxID=69181 RepID=A0A8S9G8E5_BRACR|nr:hypothetical protein F2Q68_00030288 [Brassica cretica]